MVVDQSEALLRRALPGNRVGRVVAEEGRMVVLGAYSTHLGRSFPQQPPGKKHDRPIVPEPWQQELLAAAPWAFLRGCIRSDGCVFVNRTSRYEYLGYEFANRSEDILDLFVATCRAVGLSPRRYARAARLYRRDDVAALLENVGVES